MTSKPLAIAVRSETSQALIEPKSRRSGPGLTMAEIEQLAEWALRDFGLTDLGWRFAWDRALRRAGCCKYSVRQVTLSWPIFAIETNREEVLNTILHEVAHALVGPGAGHGALWKAAA